MGWGRAHARCPDEPSAEPEGREGPERMATNKPLLVLAILDLVEAGLVGTEGLVHRDAQLNLRFRSYSPICVPRWGNAIDLGLPFRHLASDGAIPY